MDHLLAQVKDRIALEGLSAKEAAREIGVSPGSLERHLEGGYVRSDSLAKYRAWLEPTRLAASRQLALIAPEASSCRKDLKRDRFARTKVFDGPRPETRYLVVDLFSGCGGMSLGFDLFERGSVFETVLAIDVEKPMARVFNDNQPSERAVPACRLVDLADFGGETEILAYYLDHLALRHGDTSLTEELAALPVMPLSDLKAGIAELDRRFLADLQEIRRRDAYRQTVKRIPSVVLRQTSVLGFHDHMGLPMTGQGRPALGPLVWRDERLRHEREDRGTEFLSWLDGKPDYIEARSQARREFLRLWKREVAALEERAKQNGRGQLVSSAGRIRTFLDFIASEPMQRVRRLWLDWRSARDALRVLVFSDEGTQEALERAYSGGRRVAVLLGGPPCQGFSRIGRGKIRSLREHGVHVEEDGEAGDKRNRLLEAYVLSVAALRPRVFMFENVRHFQAEVKTPEGTFQATEALRAAIEEISGDELHYRVANQVLDCSRHLIPQTRERFFMAGVREDDPVAVHASDLPRWLLTLPDRSELPLRVALECLPAPLPLERQSKGTNLADPVRVDLRARSVASEEDEYLHWVTQPPPGSPRARGQQAVDAHVVRAPRADDRDFFALLGPGRRWMDYRCDSSDTRARLVEALGLLLGIVEEAERAGPERGPVSELARSVSPDDLRELLGRTNGSLSVRLLLESIDSLPGELHHHLATDSYLGKREGQHGDWLARLHPDRPSKTVMSHMGKDTYAYVHPSEPRTLSVREAARIQSFPDWFRFGSVGFVDSFRVIGNAVPPLLGHQLADRVAQILWKFDASGR